MTSKRIVLISAPWSNPCKVAEVSFALVATQFKSLKSEVLDADTHKNLCARAKVSKLPHLLLLEGDRITHSSFVEGTPSSIREAFLRFLG